MARLLLILAITIQVFYCHASAHSKTSSLRQAIFDGYDKLVKPDGKTMVHMKIHPINMGICPVKNTLFMDGWIGMMWKDERLAWNPEEFNGLTKLQIPASELWIPDLMPYNSLTGISTNGNEWEGTTRAVVVSDGTVIHVPPVSMGTYCKPSADLKAAQTCDIQMGSWTHDMSEMDLAVWSWKDGDNSAWSFDYMHNKDIEIISKSHEKKDLKYDCGDDLCDQLYPKMDLKVTFKQPLPKKHTTV